MPRDRAACKSTSLAFAARHRFRPGQPSHPSLRLKPAAQAGFWFGVGRR
jgi:hypothetical protein